MFCTIIPPYLLERVAQSGDETLAERARQTLQSDAVMRRARTARDVLPTVGTGTGPGPVQTGQVHRTIADAHHSETLPGTTVRREGEPDTGDVAVTEAYDGLGSTWRLLHDAFGRDSLDNRGLPLLGTVHYGKDYDNAFWDGTQMVFGDGDGTLFNRFTASVDVIGHELAHGMTEYTAGLNYRNQSGALNESISDVFGSMVRQLVAGQTAKQADWLIGAELLADGVNGVALRSMKAPGTAYDDPNLGKDPQPSHMKDFVDTADDNGGVHINSGIPNHAFYLASMALGGSTWETTGQYWYDALTGEGISADCDFATFAGLTIDAARARDGEEAAATIAKAWEEVGVGPGLPGSTSGEPASPAGAVQVQRMGGVAGIRRSTQINLAELPGSEAQEWHNLLDGRLEALAGELNPSDGRPDGFTYRVRYSERQLDITLPEKDLPHDIQALIRKCLP